MKQVLNSLAANRYRAKAVRTLRELEYRLPTAHTRFAVPFTFRGRGHFRSIRPRQTPEEIEQAYQAIRELAPQRVLEIGTAKGGTLYLWTQAAQPDAVLVSVDLPGGQFGGGYRPCRTAFYQAFAQPGQTLHLLREDSHAPQTLAKVQGLFDGQSVDFCFIDGDHRYPGVKADLLQYGPLVRSGGYIGFHDIMPAPHDPQIEVHQLWEQLKDRFEAREIVARDQGGRAIGIGLLRVPEEGFPSDLMLA